VREPAAAAAAGDHDDGHLVSARLSSVSRRTWTLYATLVITIGVVGWFTYSSIYGTPSSSASGIARTVTASSGTVQSSVSASGNVSATQTSSPAVETSGTLTALTVKVGSHVKSGQVIARLDATQANATLASDQASLKSARSALATAQAGGSSSQLAQNASTLATSKLQLSSAQQTLASDEATLATARKQLVADQRLGCAASSSTTPATGSSSGASTSTATGTTGASATSGTSSGNARTTQAVSSATAPTASTDAPGTTTTKAVTLTGTVNPNGAATTYVFEYGTKASFGSSTGRVSVGEGTAAVSVEATIGGLKPATTYVYRLVAENAEGTAKGLTRTFTTATTACTADSQAITTAERTVAQQKLTVAQQSQSVASAQAGVSSAVDSATVAQAAAQVTQARLTVTAAEKAVRDTVLRAPISGTVTAVNASVGDTVGSGSSAASSNSGAGTTTTGGGAATGAATSSTSSSSSSSASSGVVTIANLTKLEVVAGFAEADATKIKVGQPATVTLSALPNTSVAGTVTAVSPKPTVTSNVVTYDVTVRLISPPSSVRNGMTADVSVTVATKSNVLQLPSAAITTSGAASTVSVLQNGKQTTTRVTTGLVGSSTTEILSGIKAGDVIVEPTVSVASSTASSSSSSSLGGGGFTGGGFPGGGARPVAP
jgi:multidrug efflux pump subunit AcrA (membrane-fusion protein)